MGLAYENLDDATRQFMIEEIDMDLQAGTIYISNYLNADGCEAWPHILRTAAESGTDDSLAGVLLANSYLKTHVQRAKPSGGSTTVAVPYSAHETMGEGEFNRYYARGLCRRAINDGIATLEVYRAKAVMQPRSTSEQKLGSLVDPATILADLRRTNGVEPALGLPPGPNSGLTLRILN